MAYASVTSLLQTMEQILYTDGHEILDKKQQIEYLNEKFYFLLSFLEDCCSGNSSQAVKSLEVKIRDAAYKAEDILESYGEDQFLSESTRTGITNFMGQLISAVKNLILNLRENILILDGDQSFIRRLILVVQNLMEDHWNQNLGWEYQWEKLLEEIDAITKKAMKMKSSPNDLLLRNSVPDGSLRAASSGKRTVIGFDNDLWQIKDHLTGSSSKLKVVSIVGMGGIGKTTLTRNVYDDPLIAYHFHTRAWVMVSAQYHVKDILIDILNSMMVSTDRISRKSTEELEDLLYKSLKGLRYLIVMDDVWESRACVKRLFPDDNKGSRIMLTTRLLDVAVYPENRSSLHQLPFLNENESWNLLREKVFDGEYCPPKLEKVGYKIAQNCQGLPLAIVVIAGLLSKVKKVKYWENVAENVSSIVTKNEEKFKEILALSYSHLPHHLKACFLYMGVIPEDSEIRVTKLINLWAAEGFIKPRKEKCLEEVGEEYLQNLVDRSLILVSKRSSSGKIKTCSVHDVLRDLCVRQAHEENFLYVARSLTDLHKFSLLCTGTHLYNYLAPVFIGFRLMRVLDVVVIHFYEFPDEIIELFKLRYLGFTYHGQLPKSISKLLNLETIVHHNWTFDQCPSLPH